jgi:alanyl-tRNA synthetase
MERLMTGNEIRRIFLDFFKKHGHRVIRSSSLIPQDDPTLLFTNAGMVQFKRTFLGEEQRDYTRAASSQKCVRAGGKHNDLENVGYTARHHTFFEMLGNFSFGDYFKEKAVTFAWDLLTNGYHLPQDKLWTSVFLDDDDAYDLWHKKIGIPKERIVRLGEKDNFWAMGDTGPCGPCSEIHLDRGEAYGCGKPDCGVDCDCDRFLEIWNLVFMQYNRDASGNMTPLPKPSIDTGLGLERMAAVLQNVPNNFECDLLFPIIRRTEELAGVEYGKRPDADVAMKVIADHSRSAAFLISDGVLPSNEGRGYVLRRIMRRAIRYGRNIGLNQPFLHQTALVVFDIMQESYPELGQASAFITNVIQNEEIRFSETLDNGLRLLNDSLGRMRTDGETHIKGDLIFKLYDTYGFPVDIVQDVVRDEKMTLDKQGFEALMADQRKKSRSITAFTKMSDAYKSLASQSSKSEFVGYNRTECEADILLLVVDGKEAAAAETNDQVEIVTSKTPFYGESGGQVGDRGRITAGVFRMDVTDTVKDPTGIIIHKGNVVSGRITAGETVLLTVDTALRGATALNHTATHILHAALRKVLGEHVKQAGSLVSPERLRFDFTHFAQVEAEKLEAVETLVNDHIRANVAVNTDEMDAETAFKTGATALFEEKYGDRVRVITLGVFSKELCGGTHTQMTGDIGLFKIVSESSVASGVRRIEALTGAAAFAHVQHTTRIVQQAAHLLRDKPDALIGRIENLMAAQKAADKEIEKLKAQIAAVSVGKDEDNIKEINGVKVLAKQVAVDNPAALRDLADKLKDKLQSGIVALGGAAGGKVFLIVGVTKDLTRQYHAGNIIKAAAALVGGSGGGRPDMAQAGGSQPENLAQALEKVFEVVASM